MNLTDVYHKKVLFDTLYVQYKTAVPREITSQHNWVSWNYRQQNMKCILIFMLKMFSHHVNVYYSDTVEYDLIHRCNIQSFCHQKSNFINLMWL
jgi:hypothetical protein